MKVFITGGTGIMGRRLIPLLRSQGHEVTAPRHADLNLEDAGALKEALRGMDAAYHLATRIVSGQRTAEPGAWTENDRLRGIVTDLLVDAALEQGVRRLCHVSSTASIGRRDDGGLTNEDTPYEQNRNTSPYTISKHDAELEVQRGIAEGLDAVLAKGGITSSDVATKGLGVKRAMVLGQLLPGVPVWRLGPESRYPSAIYVVFPGNVGGSTALAEAYQLLSSG